MLRRRLTRPLLSCALSALALLGLASNACAQLDPGFGTGGHAAAQFSPPLVRASGNTLVDPIGFIYVTGARYDPVTPGVVTDIVATRFTPSGVPDANFGVEGKVTFAIAPGGNPNVHGVLDSAGRLLVLLQPYQGDYRKILILRFLAGGGLDPDFGDGGTTLVTNAFPSSASQGGSPVIVNVVLDASDRFVLLTDFISGLPSQFYDVFVSRLLAAGQFDPGFGDAGFRKFAFGTQNYDSASDLLRAPGGGFYMAMGSGPSAGGVPTRFDAIVAKLDDNGNLDPTFAQAGLLVIPSQDGEIFRIYGLRFDSAGRINMLVNRVVYQPYDSTDFISRFSPSGTLDMGFGTHGRLALPFIPTPGNYGYENFAIDAQDNFVTQFGENGYDLPPRTGILRLTKHAQYDQGFGLNGVYIDEVLIGYESFLKVIVDSGNRVLVSGTIRDYGVPNGDLGTFRLLLGPASDIALESSAMFTHPGQGVTFTARPNLDGLTGTFEFLADGLPIAGCTSVALVAGSAACTTGALSPGARSIVAHYIGDARYPDYRSLPLLQYVKPNGLVLDIDGDAQCTALSDALLVVRYLFGIRGPSLVAGALGEGATRTEDAAIAAYVAGLGGFLDIDGNGEVDALTDGLLLVRYLSGLRGASLVNGAIGPGAKRASADDVEAFIAQLVN